MRFLRFLMLAACTCLCQTMMAQGGVATFLKKVGDGIDSMSIRGVDRRYIDMPKNPWQLIVRGNVNQSVVNMKTSGSISGEEYRVNPRLRTSLSQYAGVWIGYRGYGLGYTTNVGGDKGMYLTFGATGGAYGVNVRIHSFKNSNPTLDLNSSFVPEDSKDKWREVQLTSPIRVNTVFADGYYLFNGKKFSYAAAYDQSVIQKRSAGSLMAGFMYNYSHINYAADSNGDIVFLMNGLGQVKSWQGSVGVGYAYNWVPASGLLVNVMAMPMLTLVNRIKAYGYATNVEELMESPTFSDPDISDEEWDKWFYGNLHITHVGNKTLNSNVSVGFDARMSLTYNFRRLFFNAYGQFNNIRYSHNRVSARLNDWFINASVGIRL